MEMEDINVNTRDEYGLKADGMLCALEKFETYFTLAPCCMDSFYLVVHIKGSSGKRHLYSRSCFSCIYTSLFTDVRDRMMRSINFSKV